MKHFNSTNPSAITIALLAFQTFRSRRMPTHSWRIGISRDVHFPFLTKSSHASHSATAFEINPYPPALG